MIENFIDRFVPSKDEREFLKDKSVTFSDVEQACKACFQEMLMEHYYFDREQACAISDMRMSVYTALEKDRTKKEIQELLMKM